MSIIHSREPGRCTICDYYLTTVEEFAGQRCLDPAHWQAAGVLASSDFYPMARIAARAHAVINISLNGHIGLDH